MPIRPSGPSIWDEALDMLDRAERLQRQFFRLRDGARGEPSWVPPVDVFEREGGLLIVVALPGVAPAHVEVLSDGAQLLIRGERALPSACHQAVIRQLEIPYGRFERRIALPAGEFVVVHKAFSNGCLVLALQRGATR